MKRTAKSKPAPQLTDELLESGADLSGFLHAPRAVPAMLEPQSLQLEVPAWLVESLDREAHRVGVPLQSLVNLWLVERLERSPTAA
jgi:hypothetical protein